MTSEPSRSIVNLSEKGTLLREFNFGIEAVNAPPTLASVFNLGSGGRGEDERLNLTRSVDSGAIDASKVSVILNTNANTGERAEAEKKKREERALNDRLFQMLLDRQTALQREMDQAGDELRQRYGDDFIGGMAARYLSEEELAGAQTEDERLAALARVFLDENGDIKPEFADSPEARYVRAWKERQQVEADIRDYPTMNAEQRAEVEQRTRTSTTQELFRNEEIGQQAELDEVAEVTTDQRAEVSAPPPPSASSIGFT